MNYWYKFFFFLINDYQQYQIPTTLVLSTHLMIQWESAAEKQTWNTQKFFSYVYTVIYDFLTLG